jgi:hypothetical protein
MDCHALATGVVVVGWESKVPDAGHLKSVLIYRSSTMHVIVVNAVVRVRC